MYRVIAIVLSGLALAACSSTSQWLNVFKPKPTMETVRFESTPPGAQAQLSNGQSCQTPCALAIPQPKTGGYAVTFTLNGYLPDTEQLELVTMGDNTSHLQPNPVTVQLTPTPPPKPKRRIRRHRRHVAKPAVKKPKAKRTVRPKPVVTTPPPMQPQPQQAPSPWPPVQAQPTR